MSPKTSRRPPNSTDVARLAGVSRATVSYVFNGRRDGATVPETTRSRILAIATEIGYRPNRTARALKTGRTNTIALWAASFATPYYAAVLGHVQAHSDADGYEVVVTTSDNPDILDPAHLLADGLIIIDKRTALDDAIEQGRLTTPVVSMGAYFHRSLDHVGVDLYTGTLSAIDYLVQSGKKRIAYMSHSLGTNTTERPWHYPDPRIHAYVKSTDERGKEPIWIPALQDGRQSAYNAFRTFWEARELSSPDRLPDAILCLNDTLAIGVMHYLRERGISVPGTVAVIGCDGIEDGEFHSPPLTTLVQPVAEVSRLAWEFLRHRLREPETPLQGIVLPAKLTVRGSA